MSIDTVNEKFALITIYQPYNTPIPISADGLDQADNQQLIWDYPGLLWADLTPTEENSNLLLLRVGG